MGSFSVALSGLNASSEDIRVISNDLANMNTTAYKSTRANFNDLFYQQVGTSGAGNPETVGQGVTIGSINTQFTQGSIQSDGISTDLAIQGQGFFVVNKNGTQEYTRAGNFTIGSNGGLVTSDGGQVMGYPAVNGVVGTNQAIGPLSIPTGLSIPPKATSQFQVALSLDSDDSTTVNAASQQTGTGIIPTTTLTTGGTVDFTDGTNAFSHTTAAGDTLNTLVTAINTNPNFSASISGNSVVISANSGQAVTVTTNTLSDAATGTESETFAASGTAVSAGTFSTPVTVFDALGASHVLTANFTKTAPNTWGYAITIPAADLGQTGSPVTIKSGTLVFNGNGQLTSPSNNVSIPISGLADGASNLNLTWALMNANGGGLLTQVSGLSATSSTQQDGYASGSLQTFNVAGDGTIQGIFDNGQTMALGQIALATFNNPNGLMLNGSNNYLASISSGQPNIGAPNTGGFGTVNGGALEQSNVDISTEFAALILAQRGYQASAQAVTTMNQVSQETISMIRNA